MRPFVAKPDRGKHYPLSMVPFLLALALLLVGMGVAVLAGPELSGAPRQIVISARQFAYDPPVIRVNRGQRVRLVLKSMDVTHGLALDGYGVSMMAIPGKEARAEFLASKQGKFRFRCTQTCGNLHPFMVGNLVVEPNQPLWVSLGLAGLLSLTFLGFVWTKQGALSPVPAGGSPAVPLPASPVSPLRRPSGHRSLRFDLAGNRVTRWLLSRRAFQFALFLPAIAVLFLIVVAGFAGSPVGSHNVAIVLAWLAWWPLLALVLLPIGGRAWCAMCPIPAPGDWVQRLAVVRKREGRPLSLARRWPRALRNMWLQNLSFLTVAALSALVLTIPAATAATLVGFVSLAVLMALVFRDRSFCRYVCPLGGFIGLYSLAAPLALRVKDAEVCRNHKVKDCLQGNGAGYGCPWFEYPGTMERNAYCGLCMECIKTCPRDNIAVGFQAPGHDLTHPGGRLDEAYKAFIALSAALVYTVVMLGPWGWLKTWAASPLTPGFALYIALLAGSSLIVLPALFLGAAYLLRRLSGLSGVAVKQLWISLSYTLVPLGLLAWVAFTLTFLSANGSYVATVVSDPLGRGWDLFGTADAGWAPLFPQALPYLQTGALLLGLAWSLSVLRRRTEGLVPPQGQRAWWGLAPPVILLFSLTAAFLWLFLG